MAIDYVAFDAKGQRVAGSLPVESEQAAEELLWKADLTVVSLKKKRPPLSQTIYAALPSFFGPKSRDLVDFSRGIATLLEAGISLLPSLRFVTQRVRSPLLVNALTEIAVDIESGFSFSEAVAKHKTIFPEIFIRLITTSEQTGQMAPALRQAADYIERMSSAASKVKRALAYPIVVSLVAVGAAIVMLFFAIPAMSVLFAEFGGELPLATRILIASSDFAKGNFLSIVGVSLLVFGGGWLYFFRTVQGKERWDELVLRVPVFGNVVQYSNTSRAMGTLSTLLQAGLPVIEAMDLTASILQNGAAKAAMSQIKQDVITGEEFSKAIARHSRIFPELVSQMIYMGEQSGTLEENLETVSRFFEQEMDTAIGNLTGMLGPALTLLMGGGVGFIAVAMISAMYGLIDNIR